MAAVLTGGPSLSRNWWALAIRGVIAILFGIVAIVFTGATALTLVLLFGAFAFLDGIFAIAAAAARVVERRTEWWPLLVEGIIGIIIGVITLVVSPGLTALALLYLIAAWAFLTGVFELVAAFRLRQSIPNEIWLVIAGIASIIFAIIAVIHPMSGIKAIVWVIGVYAVLFGIFLLVLAFRLRSLHTQLGGQAPAASAGPA